MLLFDFFPGVSAFSGIPPLSEAAVFAVVKPFADCRFKLFVEQQDCEFDGRTVGNCPVEILPHVTVSCDDVAASAVDGGICTVLVTILLDGGAGDYA